MNTTSDFKPNWASAPGDTIAEILKDRKLSLSEFAKQMNSTTDYIRQLLHGYVFINDDIATQLENKLGASASFWISRENNYRESIKRLREDEEKKWIQELPMKDMIEFGWLPHTQSKIQSCLDYFNVPDVWTWRRKYSEVISLTAFRQSSIFKSQPAAVSAWLRQGEIQASKMQYKSWDKDLFKNVLLVIRKLVTRKSPNEFLPFLRQECANCGVALAIVKSPAGCSVSGATQFISENLALITLSFRYKTDDQFWFTFFHEAGHLILHDEKILFIEEEINSGEIDQKEVEANAFSSEILIPKKLQNRLKTMQINKREIMNFAKDADTSLGIVVGQLQHLGRVEYKNLNGYKRRYSWEEIFS